MKEKQETKLKRCKLCGGKAEAIICGGIPYTPENERIKIWCKNKKCRQTTRIFKTREGAIQEWNRMN